MKCDFAVIGAGASGLTASLILAKNGYKVALVEKAKKAAPLLRGFSRRGLRFDTGFHYTGGLGEGEILDLFFRYLGIRHRLQPEPCDPECFDLCRFGNPEMEMQFPFGFDRIRDRLRSAFPKETAAVDGYLQAIEAHCSSRPYLNLDIDINPWQTMKGLHGPTLEEVLDSLTDNVLLKRVLSSHCLLYGVTADEALFIDHACIIGPYYHSANLLRGGGLSLVRAFDEALKEQGVEVLCGQGASEILFSSDRTVKGVRLADDAVIQCKGCVCTLHPRYLPDLVPGSLFRPGYVNRLKSLEETISAHILYGECLVPSRNMARTNILFSPGDGYPGFGTDRPVEDRPFYLTFLSPTDKDVSRQGFMAIFPAAVGEVGPWAESVTGNRPEDYGRFKDKIAREMQGRIEASCPELSGGIEPIECSTPLTLRDFSNSPSGSLYGVKHKAGQYNPNPVTRLGGLFLAGQATVAPGVLGAVISGFVACGNILGHYRLRGEIKKCV